MEAISCFCKFCDVAAGSETEDAQDTIALASIFCHPVPSARGTSHLPSHRSFCPSGLSSSTIALHLLIHFASFQADPGHWHYERRRNSGWILCRIAGVSLQYLLLCHVLKLERRSICYSSRRKPSLCCTGVAYRTVSGENPSYWLVYSACLLQCTVLVYRRAFGGWSWGTLFSCYPLFSMNIYIHFHLAVPWMVP